MTRTPLASTLILSILAGSSTILVPCLASALVALYITLEYPFILSQRDRSDMALKVCPNVCSPSTDRYRSCLSGCTPTIAVPCLASVLIALYITLKFPLPHADLRKPRQYEKDTHCLEIACGNERHGRASEAHITDSLWT